ncbi:MAG: hypothetical protein ABEK16_03755 [Candidatus Nanohalobium sp.]
MLGKDEELEEKELTDMGELAKRIQNEEEHLEREEKLDEKILADVQDISSEMQSLREDEERMREIWGKE